MFKAKDVFHQQTVYLDNIRNRKLKINSLKYLIIIHIPKFEDFTHLFLTNRIRVLKLSTIKLLNNTYKLL